MGELGECVGVFQRSRSRAVASPRIGLAATIGTIIALNLGMAALIDRFGWFGFDRIAITWTRVAGVAGLVCLGLGAALSLYKS